MRLRRLAGPEGVEWPLIPAPFVRTTWRSRTVTFSIISLAAAASTRTPAPDALRALFPSIVRLEAVQPLARIVRTSAFTPSPSRITVASGPDPKTQTLVRARAIGDVTR